MRTTNKSVESISGLHKLTETDIPCYRCNKTADHPDHTKIDEHKFTIVVSKLPEMSYCDLDFVFIGASARSPDSNCIESQFKYTSEKRRAFYHKYYNIVVNLLY